VSNSTKNNILSILVKPNADMVKSTPEPHLWKQRVPREA
jgi:hypothetical protein